MGVFIPNQLLDRILAETDLVELVSSYFPLKKAGRNFRALCPFHPEKTPSFMVNREKQIYKCFGCGKGGNAFHFLMEKEGIPFQEAVETLARKANIVLPERKGAPHEKENREEMFATVAFAVAYYREQLSKPAGEGALAYLRKRNISDATVEKFCLGYAPKAWESFYERGSRKFKPSLLEKLGLIVPREKATGYYDRFRNRVMFPIFDPRGRAIGFSGRAMPEEEGPDTPKYVNSPESPLFNKSEILYGLNFSRGEIARQNRAIVCEGHMDMIAIDQAGFGNAVAAQGTSFTLAQARLLKRYCSEVVFAFDADSAGQEATLRSFEPLLETGLDVRVVVVPEGYDPDLLIREKGAEAFRQLLDKAVELVDFQYEVLRKKNDLGTLAGRRAVASQMLLTAQKSPSDIVRDAWIQKIAKTLDIPEATLRAEMRRIRGAYRPFASADAGSRVREGVREGFALKESQRAIVGYMLQSEEVRVLVSEHLTPDDFDDAVCRAVMGKILSLHQGGHKVKAEALLREATEAGEAELIAQFVMEPLQSDKPMVAAKGIVCHLSKRRESRKHKEELDALQRSEKEAEERSRILRTVHESTKSRKTVEVDRKRF